MLPSLRIKDAQSLIAFNWRLRLKRLGKNQQDIAKALNISEVTISSIFTQKCQSRVKTLDKIEKLILTWEFK